ncbi:hypothetical protein GQ457_08G024790 [Hibiscus cannabinus]
MRSANLPTTIIPVPKPEKELKLVKEGKLSDLEVVRYVFHYFETLKGLVMDLMFSVQARKDSQNFFMVMELEDALRVIKVELNFRYGVFYTKIKIMHSLPAAALFLCFLALQKPKCPHPQNSSSNSGRVLFSTKKINVTLDDNNYLLWHQQVLLTIKTNRLQKFNDDKSRMVLLHPGFCPMRLLHSQKKGDLIMREYLMKIKSICDKLASCGEIVSDNEHVTTILNGLSPEYESVIKFITASSTPFDVKTVRTILLDADARQVSALNHLSVFAHIVVQQQPIVDVHTPVQSENLAHVHTIDSYNSSTLIIHIPEVMVLIGVEVVVVFRGYPTQANVCTYTSQGNGVVPCHTVYYAQAPASTVISPQVHPQIVAPTPKATLVNSSPVMVPSFTIDHTYVPYGGQQVQTSQLQTHVCPQALLATPEVVADNSWYPDYGATHHLTSDISNLNVGTVHPGSGKVRVGNGNAIPICFVG